MMTIRTTNNLSAQLNDLARAWGLDWQIGPAASGYVLVTDSASTGHQAGDVIGWRLEDCDRTIRFAGDGVAQRREVSVRTTITT